MVVDNLGIIDARVDDAVLTQLGWFSDAAEELG
jgi:hypothetical protein